MACREHIWNIEDVSEKAAIFDMGVLWTRTKGEKTLLSLYGWSIFGLYRVFLKRRSYLIWVFSGPEQREKKLCFRCIARAYLEYTGCF